MQSNAYMDDVAHGDVALGCMKHHGVAGFTYAPIYMSINLTCAI